MRPDADNFHSVLGSQTISSYHRFARIPVAHCLWDALLVPLSRRLWPFNIPSPISRSRSPRPDSAGSRSIRACGRSSSWPVGPVVSFLLLALLYALNWSGPLGKRANGGRWFWAWPLFGPYFLLSEISYLLARKSGRVEPHAEIAPGLYLGRRLTAAEAEEAVRTLGIRGVVDLACEFSEVPDLPRGRVSTPCPSSMPCRRAKTNCARPSPGSTASARVARFTCIAPRSRPQRDGRRGLSREDWPGQRCDRRHPQNQSGPRRHQTAPCPTGRRGVDPTRDSLTRATSRR